MQTIIQYAIDNKVPIIQNDSLNLLLKVIEKKKPKRILEIGTAIGYSAINMALVNSNIIIDSLEKDEKRYLIAQENVQRFNLSQQINLYLIDAEQFITNEKYDLVFIDAAKAKNLKFFLQFESNFSDSVIIFSDNLIFHGLVENPQLIKTRRMRTMIRKINQYREFLAHNKQYQTVFYDYIGDGVAITKKTNL